MTYQKRQPKIMSDGNIARVGMLVTHLLTNKVGRIEATKLNSICKEAYYPDRINDDTEVYVFYKERKTYSKQLDLIRKATLEEKKQYWAKLAQR